jgi:VCBS repeat-containing protein
LRGWSRVSGSGSFTWHYSVDNADVQFLAQGQTLI